MRPYPLSNPEEYAHTHQFHSHKSSHSCSLRTSGALEYIPARSNRQAEPPHTARNCPESAQSPFSVNSAPRFCGQWHPGFPPAAVLNARCPIFSYGPGFPSAASPEPSYTGSYPAGRSGGCHNSGSRFFRPVPEVRAGPPGRKAAASAPKYGSFWPSGQSSFFSHPDLSVLSFFTILI